MNTPAEAAQALGPVVEDIFQALRAGLRVSQKFHADNHFDRRADAHLATQMVRREVVERLRSTYDAESDASENLGLPMSGIIVQLPGQRVLRVWHSSNGDLPPAITAPLRAFYHQQPSGLGGLVPLPFTETEGLEPSNLAILWDYAETEVTRFELVRTMGLDGKKPLVEWRLPLLAQRIDDIEYGHGGAAGLSDAG